MELDTGSIAFTAMGILLVVVVIGIAILLIKKSKKN